MSAESRTLRQYAELSRAGHKIDLTPSQFSEQTAKQLEALLEVTRLAGGPIAKTLDRLASVVNTREQTRRELELAAAGPKASSRLVMSLPFLVFIGSGIAGIPIFRVLLGSQIVWGSLTLGLIMFWVGSRWTSRILNRAEPGHHDPGLELDALAIALKAGLPLSSAAELTRLSDTAELQELATGTGIALSELVTDRADSLRLEQFNADRLKIQKASVAVLWPLGLTVLPAFVLIAIVPVGTALIQSQ